MTLNSRIAAATVAALAGSVAAQTITVDTLYDVTDFGGQQRVADLPGPGGKISFREALTAANNTPGPQTIEFAIPRDEWWLVDYMALLRLEDGSDPFVVMDDGLTIDFLSQRDFTGDTNPNGTEVGIYGLQPNGSGTPAIMVLASDCVFRGLGDVHQRSAAISVWSGDRNRFVGNVTGSIELAPYFTTSTGNIVGGTDPEDANTLGGVAIRCGASDNVVIGNRLGSVSITGYSNCGDPPSRNRIGGPTPQERNVFNGFGRYGHEGLPVGAGVLVEWADETLIEGNYIGVTEDGMSGAGQRGPTGVHVADSTDTTIRGNLISGLRVMGINHYAGQLFGEAILVTTRNTDTVGTVIEDNLIGTDATGQAPIETLNGIVVKSLTYGDRPRETRIGGVQPGQANVIAFTERNGVVVLEPTTDTEISGNSIHSNGLLGIDLGTWFDGADGVTPNDPGDGDTAGGNELQNFPVLVTAETTGNSVQITGTLNSRPGGGYRIEFFASSECDTSGHGEGERFLGSFEVVADGAGDAPFDVRIAASVAPGEFVTATATDLTARATSEFSACVEAASGGCAADMDGDGDADVNDFFAYLDLFAAGDPRADVTGDGSVDVNDFFAYLDLFAAGC